MRLGHGARRRAEPERAVVGLAVVVAGHPEAQREDQDDQRRGERPPGERLAEVGGALHAVAQARRVERREVGRGVVVAAQEGADGGVDDEGREHDERGQRAKPPPVLAQRPRLDAGPGRTASRLVGRRHASSEPEQSGTAVLDATLSPTSGAVSRLSGSTRAPAGHMSHALGASGAASGAIRCSVATATHSPDSGQGRAGLALDHRAEAADGRQRHHLHRLRARAHVRQPQGLRRPRRLQRVRPPPAHASASRCCRTRALLWIIRVGADRCRWSCTSTAPSCCGAARQRPAPTKYVDEEAHRRDLRQPS